MNTELNFMSPENIFWNWFKKNEYKYFFFGQINDEAKREALSNELLQHLHQYSDKLFFEIGGIPGEKQDFIITAEGKIEHFDQVENLKKEAPALDHWNVIAFKPVKSKAIVRHKELRLDANEMWFMPLENKQSQKIGLRVYVETYSVDKDQDFLFATYLVLDNILGEKDFAINIGHVEMDNLSSQPTANLIELSKLPKFIQWKKSKM